MTREEAYLQGMQKGHSQGKERVGVYVLCEEILRCYEQVGDQSLPDWATSAWSLGFRRGYKLGAEGKPLPEKE